MTLSDRRQDLLFRLIPSLDVIERRGKRVTIDYFADVLVRELGINPQAGLLLLEYAVAEGIVERVTAPIPENSDRPTRCLWLNREHPVVKAVLGNEPLPEPKPQAPIGHRVFFEPVTIRGEAASVTLIRERR